MPPGNNQQQQDDFELRSWLADIAADGSLSQEEIGTLQNILGKEKVTGRLKDQVLMRRDYSRKTQELGDQRRSLEADVQAVLDERTNLANWKKDLDTKYNKALADLESARITEGQFRARIKSIADRFGADETSLLEGIAAPAANPQNNGGGDRGGGNGNGNPPVNYVTVEEFQRQVNRFDSSAPALMAEFADLSEEHMELFGKSLRTFEYTDASGNVLHGRSALLAKAMETNGQLGRQNKPQRSLRQIWEQTFEVPKKRQELERAAIETEVRGKLETEMRRQNTEAAMNGGNLRGMPQQREHSPIFARDMKTPAEKDAEAAAAARNGNTGNNGNNQPLPQDRNSAVGREQRWMKAAESFQDRRSRGVPLGQPETAKSA
jgi:hypothetical protein